MSAELKIVISEEGAQQQHAAESSQPARAPQYAQPSQQAQQPAPPPPPQQPTRVVQQQPMPTQSQQAVKPPERRFSQEQWQAIPEKDRMAVAKQYGMAPPEGAQQAAQPRQQSWQNREIEQKASERLRKIAEQQQVEMAMRAMSPEYRTAKEQKEAVQTPQERVQEKVSQQIQHGEEKKYVEQGRRAQDPQYREQAELADAYRDNAKAIRELTEQAREEKIALSKMTQEQRVEHLAQKDYSRQMEAKAVQDRVQQMMKPAEQPKQERNQWEKLFDTAKEQRSNPFASMIARFEPLAKMVGLVEQEKKEAVQPVPQRATQRAVEIVQGQFAGHGPRQQAPYDATTAYDVEKAPRPINKPLSDAQQAARPIPPQVPTAAVAPPGSGPSAPYARPAPPKAQTAPPAPPPGDNSGILSAVTMALPEIGMAIQAVQVAAQVVKGVAEMPQRMMALNEAAAKNMVVGGPHQMSRGMDISAQQQAAQVDWIPIIGPAMGSIISAPTKMMAKGMEIVEERFVEMGQATREVSRGMSELASFDSKGLASHMGEIAEQRIPLFGTVIHAATDSVLQLDRAVESSAKRLSAYSGQLANQSAQHEVRELMREINRAQRHGESITGANEARFNMEQKLQDVTDRFIPFIMKFCEKLFAAVERGLTIGDAVLKATLEQVAFVLRAVNLIPGIDAAMLAIGIDLPELRRLVREALQDNRTGVDQQHWNDFNSAARGFGVRTINEQAAAPRPAIQAP